MKQKIKLIFLVLSLLTGTAGVSFAQAATDVFTVTGTWTAPAGVTSVDVEVWGGGGAGGGQNLNSDGGGGGGGGAYSRVVGITVIPGNIYSFTVGVGGVGVASGTGGTGGDTYFINAATVMAKGGVGGAPSTGTPPAGGAGGAAASGVGATRFSGGNGSQGLDSGTGQGGPGGSSAGTAANGTSGPTPWSTRTAAAAPTGGGIGGNGGNSGNNGVAPASGNGGGGGGSGEGAGMSGGNGANGKISITYATVLAEYRFDESGAGTVADSSGNGLNGSLSGGVSVGGTGKVCSSYNFNGTNAFVSVPHNALLNRPNVSLSAWVRHLGATMKTWEAILAKGDTAYRLHLNGGCSINTPNTPNGLSFGINGGCNTADIDSGTVPTVPPVASQWYHVVGTYDGISISIYVDGALTASAGYTGAIGNNTFPLYIGENSQQTGRYWSGDIDEVKIFDAALTAAEVAAVYNNENTGKNWDGSARICPLVWHIAIDAPPEGMAFVAEPVVIAPHTSAHNPIAGAGTVYLSTNTGLGDWTIGTGTGTLTPGAANSGQATYTFGVGESAATLGFTYRSAGTVILGVKDTTATGVDLLWSTPVAEKANTITFTVPSFVFTNGSCVHNVAFGAAGQTCTLATWASQIAGLNSAGVYIAAVNTSGIPTRLNTAVRTRNMQFGLACLDPVANAGKQATFAGVTLPLCQANGATPTSWSAILLVTFNAGVPSSNAAYTFNYADVGQVKLWMRNSVSTTQVGASGAFVVKPGGFLLSAIQQTVSPYLANPAAADAAGNKFVKAGEAFSVTVSATTSGGAVTPNYGKETAPESVKLTSALATGLGLTNNPALSGSFGSFGLDCAGAAGTAGTACGTAFSWGEVGIITLTPSVGDGDYLGAGDTAGTVSGNVGRFVPDHFHTAITWDGNLSCPTGLTCPCPPHATCPPSLTRFVYSGMAFITNVFASNVAGQTTRNYVGNFAHDLTLSAVDAATGGVASPEGSISSGSAVVASAFVLGTTGAGVQPTPVYTFTDTSTIPTDIYMRAVENAGADGVTSADSTWEQGIKVVSGHIKVSNAYGSELLPLTLVAAAQYYSSTGWINSTTDSITKLTLSASYPVGAGSTAVTLNPVSGVLTSGLLSIKLDKPSAGAGAVTITPIVVPGCLPVIPGTATFGIYKNNNNFIYRRESY